MQDVFFVFNNAGDTPNTADAAIKVKKLLPIEFLHRLHTLSEWIQVYHSYKCKTSCPVFPRNIGNELDSIV